MKLMQGSGGFYPYPDVLTAPDGKCYAFANVRVGTSADNAAETKIIFSMRSPDGEWTAPENNCEPSRLGIQQRRTCLRREQR